MHSSKRKNVSPFVKLFFSLYFSNIDKIPASHQEDQALRVGRREEAQGTNDPVLVLGALSEANCHCCVRTTQSTFQNSQI